MPLEPVQGRRRMLLHFHSPEKSLFLNLSFRTHWTTLQQERNMKGEQQKHIEICLDMVSFLLHRFVRPGRRDRTLTVLPSG